MTAASVHPFVLNVLTRKTFFSFLIVYHLPFPALPLLFPYSPFTIHDSQFTIHFCILRLMPQFNWNDSVNFLKKLTFRRVWNYLKVLSSYHVSKWTKKSIQWGYPVSISFEPTTS